MWLEAGATMLQGGGSERSGWLLGSGDDEGAGRMGGATVEYDLWTKRRGEVREKELRR